MEYRSFDDLLIELQPGHSQEPVVLAELERLESAPAGAPDLVIEVTRSDTLPGPPPGAGGHVFRHGLLRGFNGAEGFLVSGPDARALVADGGRSVAVTVAPGGEVTAQVAVFVAFSFALRWRGRFHLHAAAIVDTRARGVLFPGLSGCGKSTAAALLVEQGASFVSDDVVFLRAGATSVAAFPRVFHLDDQAARALPQGARHLGRQYAAATSKRELDPWAAFPGRYWPRIEHADLLLFPRVAPAERTAARPLDAATGLMELLRPSGLMAVDGAARPGEHMRALQALVSSARCFALTLGRDALDHPGLLLELVEDL